MENLNLVRFNRYYRQVGPVLAKPEIQAYAMVILSLLTLSFFGYFALKPTFTTITLLNRQIKDAKLVDLQLQQKINALSMAQIEYQKIQPDLSLLSLALPTEPQFPSLVKAVEKIATESGIQLKSINFKTVDLETQKKATRSASLIPISFDLDIIGDYPKLDNFITKLSSLPRLVVIEKMGFTKTDAVEALIVAKVFYEQ